MFFFRIDLGSKYGLGHYARVKSLIRYLKIKKFKIIVDTFPPNHLTPKEQKSIIKLNNKKVIRNELTDAKLFINILKKYGSNFFVVKDSYKLGFKWEKYVSKYSKKLAIIDDFPNKKHYSDIYINHSPEFLETSDNTIIDLKKKNKKKCKFLLGPSYSLFNTVCNEKKILSDLVFYNGGSGDILIYEKVIKDISKLKKKLKIILIVGPYAKNYNIIYQKLKNYKNIKIIYNNNNILKFLKGTKLFISSAGVSMFESSFLKIPTLLFKMNYNQKLNDLDYEKIGHYFILKKKDLLKTKKIIKLIILMKNNSKIIKKIMNKIQINPKNISSNYLKAFNKL